jgi:hypothetical protein
MAVMTPTIMVYWELQAMEYMDTTWELQPETQAYGDRMSHHQQEHREFSVIIVLPPMELLFRGIILPMALLEASIVDIPIILEFLEAGTMILTGLQQV